MTGLEAISNLVPVFKPVEWRNALVRLTWTIGLLIALFGPARELARSQLRFQTWLSAVFVLVLLVLIWAMLQGVQYRQPEHADLGVFGTVQSIAVGLFTTYLYPFELTSLLLLVAAIGAIYLSRKRIDDQ